ncbi:rRNA-binding ribosome biosynthesis protein utp25 [Oleoguttula sp. CCFEE 5521]
MEVVEEAAEVVEVAEEEEEAQEAQVLGEMRGVAFEPEEGSTGSLTSDEESADEEDDEVDQSDGSENEASDVDDDEVPIPSAQAYSTLLASFKPMLNGNERPNKRRKLELAPSAGRNVENGTAASTGSPDGSDAEPGLEVDGESDAEDTTTGMDEAEGQHREADKGDDADDDLDEDTSVLDPFEVHFANPDDNELTSRLRDAQAGKWKVEKHRVYRDGLLSVAFPDCVSSAAVVVGRHMSVSDLPLKQKLVDTARKHLGKFDDIQRVILPHLFEYRDLLISDRTPSNAGGLRNLACVHALNHVLKGRDQVLKNTGRLAHSEGEDIPELRDQGFTRPKVLILTETRQMASKYADCIVNLFAPDQQENKQRFKDSFDEAVVPRPNMAEDYTELFGGNNDNNFLTALKFTRKTLKYFSAFYTSDIILASPLGLRRIIENPDRRKRDHDFLSSIELCIVDQADAMQMQSWENVSLVFSHLNLQPTDLHGCDISRVRHAYLDGNAKHFRQTVLFSAYTTPQMLHLYNSLSNIAGKAKLTPSYAGAITSLTDLGIKQTFSRFSSPSPLQDPDIRFKYFTTAVLPSLLRLTGTMVFIPSYFDFLRIRNFFATSDLTSNISFGAIHDYSDVSSQRRARSHFMNGRHSVLLYTQRAHHFFRLKLKGVKRIVFYGVPDSDVFYRELVEGLEEGEGEKKGVRVLFGKWDGLALERVVGSKRIGGLIGGRGDVFEFL